MTTDINSGGCATPGSSADPAGDALLAEMLEAVETCDAPVDAYLVLRDVGASDEEIREYLAYEINLAFCAKSRRAGFTHREVMAVRSEDERALADLLRHYIGALHWPITREQVFELDRLGINPNAYRIVRSEHVSHERALELITQDRDPDDSYSDVPDGAAAWLGLR